MALPHELLRNADAGEVRLAVVNDDLLPDRLALSHDLVRRGHVRERRVRAGDGLVRDSLQAVSSPAGARCDDDYFGAVVERALAIEVRARDHLDVLQLVELDLAVVDHAAPLAEAGRFGTERMWPPTCSAASTRWTRRIPRLASKSRTPSGRARADDEDVVVGILRRRELLGAPAAPELLGGGGVLGADERRATDLPTRDADVAADALADVVEPALLDLSREERIGDPGPCRPESAWPLRITSTIVSGS